MAVRVSVDLRPEGGPAATRITCRRHGGRRPEPAATSTQALASDSTARAFALLSPAEVCIVLPGTRVDGGVVA